MKTIFKPPVDEFQQNAPMLAALIPNDGNLLDHFAQNMEDTVVFLSSLSPDELLYRYAAGKWTIKEIIVHIIDMERIYGYRMLCIGRGDQTLLPGFDDEAYVRNSLVNDRDIFSLLSEFSVVRKATIRLLDGFPEEALLRKGSVRGQQVSVRALAWHIAGHELHHINVIKTLYLK
jgi:uncharacterized damage-inducible protein DinB